MNAKRALLVCTSLLSLAVLMQPAQSAQSAQGAAQNGKPFVIHRLYTGPDGQTHVEEIPAKFGPNGTEGFKLMAGAGAEIRRAPPGRVADCTLCRAANTSSP
jgi:hypothetical protein